MAEKALGGIEPADDRFSSIADRRLWADCYLIATVRGIGIWRRCTVRRAPAGDLANDAFQNQGKKN